MAYINSSRKVDWVFIIIALFSLFIGIVFYIYDRPASHTYFIPNYISQYHHSTLLFGFIGNYLPTFLHVFAFSLLTFGILGGQKRDAICICLFWLFIDAIFEIAQYHNFSSSIVAYIPDWFNHIPILENTKNYFMKGSFDVWDLVSIVIGAAFAYLLIITKYTRHHKSNLVKK